MEVLYKFLNNAHASEIVVTEDDVEDCLEEADFDGDGKISKEDFMTFVQIQTHKLTYKVKRIVRRRRKLFGNLMVNQVTFERHNDHFNEELLGHFPVSWIDRSISNDSSNTIHTVLTALEDSSKRMPMRMHSDPTSSISSSQNVFLAHSSPLTSTSNKESRSRRSESFRTTCSRVIEEEYTKKDQESIEMATMLSLLWYITIYNC